MSISMYEASIPVLVRALSNLAAVLKKAEAHVETHKIKPEVLVNSRLYPDMLPLYYQVYLATDMSKGCGARLAGIDSPKYEDVEQTFPELIARLEKTIAFLQSLKPEQIDGSQDRDITLKFRKTERKFKGAKYLFEWVLPNVFFHVTTAYDILRHNGVVLGKNDYLGDS